MQTKGQNMKYIREKEKYDEIKVKIPKEEKAEYAAYCKHEGKSMNAMTKHIIYKEMKQQGW